MAALTGCKPSAANSHLRAAGGIPCRFTGRSGLTRAASSFPVLKVDEERWEENRMVFRVRALGQAASGHLDVADDHVLLEVTLPWLLQRFAQAAQVAIRNRGNLLLTKR